MKRKHQKTTGQHTAHLPKALTQNNKMVAASDETPARLTKLSKHLGGTVKRTAAESKHRRSTTGF